MGCRIPMGIDKLALAYPTHREDDQANHCDEDTAPCTAGLDGPAEQQAKPAKIGVAKGGVGVAERSQHAKQEGG